MEISAASPKAAVGAKVKRGNPGKLTHATEFRAVLAAEFRLTGKCFVARALPNTYAGARLGLVVSRKAAPRAMDRNRGKRLVRAAFRMARSRLPSVDIVFQQKNNLRNMNNPAIRSDIEQLLRTVVRRFGV